MDIDLEYVILQNKYRRNNINKKDIFPYEWYAIKEYDLKKKILKECLDNKYLICESKYYYDYRMSALNSYGE